jgi:hypothetical protein
MRSTAKKTELVRLVVFLPLVCQVMASPAVAQPAPAAACGTLVAKGAAKSQQKNRCQVFVVGMADDLDQKAGDVTNLMRDVMRKTAGIELLDLAERLQAAAPPKIREFQAQAREGLKAAKSAMREMEHAKAIQKAREARATFEKMGGFLDPLERYKEALLIIAVANGMLGDVRQAKQAFLDLLLLDPFLKLPKGSTEGFVVELFEQVKQSLASQPLGSLSVKTEPPGGNLFVDGKLRGVVPLSLDGLVAGNHLVVVKLPGFQNWGQVIRVEPGEHQVVDTKLTAGEAGRGFVQTAERACRAITDQDLRGEVLRLGQNVGLDWAVLGQIKHDAYEVDLRLFLFEFSRAQVVHEDKLSMESTEYGMEEDVRRFGNKFMTDGLKALERFREQGDPLTGRSGTEDWYQDDSEKDREHRDTRAGQEDRRTNPQKEVGDPLDDRDGTEDW